MFERSLEMPRRPGRRAATITIAASLLLAACTSSSHNSANQSSSPSNAAPSASASTAPTTQAASSAPASASSSAASAAPSKSGSPEVLTIFSDWTGGDQSNFGNVVAEFTKETGIDVELSGSTDFLPVLQTRIASGNVPMVAIVPRPGVIADFVSQKLLQPLDSLGVDVAGNFSSAMASLGAVDGKNYGLVVKANSKSVIYYRPQAISGAAPAPATWDAFKALLTQTATGSVKPLVVTAKDSWTLTDWFENVYLRTAGPDKYQQLFTGKLPFTDPSVKTALQTMLSIIGNSAYVTGGLQVAQSTGYNDGLARVFGLKPDADFIMEGGFTTSVVTTSVNTKVVPGKDMSFFPFPDINSAYKGSLELGADFAVAFKSNDATKKFMAFLAQPSTAKLFAAGGVITPNKNADTSALPNVLIQKESQLITTATTVVFDGSDQMPGGVGNDWASALQGIYASPNSIDSILSQFQASAKSSGFGS